MYKELVKQLRDAATMSDALAVLLPHSEGTATAKLYKEAADAIEHMQKTIVRLENELGIYDDLPMVDQREPPKEDKP